MSAGNKLPKSKQLYKKLANSEFVELVELLETQLFLQPLHESEYDIKIPDRVKHDEFPTLHSSHVDCWRPLLGAMGRYRSGARTNLIQAIIATMHDAKCGVQWCHVLAGWVGILLNYTGNTTTSDNDHGVLMYPSTSDDVILDLTNDTGIMAGSIQPNPILEMLRIYPGWYTYAITLKLLSDSHIPKPLCDGYVELALMVTMSQRIATPLNTPVPITSEEYVKELQCLGEDERSDVTDDVITAGDKSNTVYSKWRLASGGWYDVPIGCVPHQTITPVSLDLPLELDPPYDHMTKNKDVPVISDHNDPWPISDNTDTPDDCNTEDITSNQLKLIQEAITSF